MSNATRTPQQAMADAIKSGAVQAFVDGKKVQYSGLSTASNWKNLYHESPNFCEQSIIWRPAPTPRLRPWRGGHEVPKLSIYRANDWTEDCWSLIIGASNRGIEVSKVDCVATISLYDAFKNGKHSLDGGKTWHPCGVQEGGE